MSKKEAHVRLFNLENPTSRNEYEKLLSNLANSPQRYILLRPVEKVMKSFTRGDIDSKETYQEVWLLVEYMEIQNSQAKSTENVFA